MPIFSHKRFLKSCATKYLWMHLGLPTSFLVTKGQRCHVPQAWRGADPSMSVISACQYVGLVSNWEAPQAWRVPSQTMSVMSVSQYVSLVSEGRPGSRLRRALLTVTAV